VTTVRRILTSPLILGVVLVVAAIDALLGEDPC
jgi:hypothetical protein